MKLSTPFSTTARNNLLGLLLIVVFWWALALFYPRYVLPSPAAVLRAVPDYLGAAFVAQLAVTLIRVVLGFGIAFVLGTLFGVLSFVLRLTGPFNSFMLALQVIPGLILGIVLLIALGVGSGVPIALVALLTLPTVGINTANALTRRSASVEQYLISAGATRRELVRHLYLPSLVPTFQSNLTIGFGLALKVVVLGEFIGSQDGIGYLLNVATLYYNMRAVLFYLCVILAFTAVFEVAQSFVFTAALAKYFYPE